MNHDKCDFKSAIVRLMQEKGQQNSEEIAESIVFDSDVETGFVDYVEILVNKGAEDLVDESDTESKIEVYEMPSINQKLSSPDKHLPLNSNRRSLVDY